MWRFILVTFAFLGWAFFVLSGGSDYAPVENSIQARAKLKQIRPKMPPAASQVAQRRVSVSEDAVESVARQALSSVNELDLATDDQVAVTLASVNEDDATAITAQASLRNSEGSVASPELSDAPESPEVPEAAPTDVRRVKGFIVNLRDGPSTYYLSIGRLNEGDEIEVLENPGEGWIKVREPSSQQVGWVAARLLTAASN